MPYFVGVQVAKLQWRDQLGRGDANRVQWPIQMPFPEREEFMQAGKARRQIIFLP